MTPDDPWNAGLIRIDEAIARTCIAEQFPQLQSIPVALLGEGWDNAAFTVGDYVFRFPRRRVAVPLIETEMRVLPPLAPHLPLPISTPAFAGHPSAHFPAPFAGYRALPGASLLERARTIPMASELGAFLRALHAVALPHDVRIPGDELGRLNPDVLVPRAIARLEELHAGGIVADADGIAKTLRSFDTRGEGGWRRIVHGDLYAAHIIVDDGHVSGIIDWGDVHVGDPAVDLSVAFETLDPSQRAPFFDAYGSIDEQTAMLARFRGLYHAILVAHYGHRSQRPLLLEAGVRGITSAMS